MSASGAKLEDLLQDQQSQCDVAAAGSWRCSQLVSCAWRSDECSSLALSLQCCVSYQLADAGSELPLENPGCLLAASAGGCAVAAVGALGAHILHASTSRRRWAGGVVELTFVSFDCRRIQPTPVGTIG